jgi:hypothetical protein
MHRHALYIANCHPFDANLDSGLDWEGDGGRLCGTFAQALCAIADDAHAQANALRGDAEHSERANAYGRVSLDALTRAALVAAGRAGIPEPDALRVVARHRVPDHCDYTVTALREGDPYPCSECGAAGRVTAIHSDRNGTQFDAFATCAPCLREWEATFGESDALTPELRATLDADNCATCGLDAWTCAAHHGDAHNADADADADAQRAERDAATGPRGLVEWMLAGGTTQH